MNHISHFLSELSHKLLLLALILFSLLRFPSLFEPYWYGDEGIYQIIGRALNRGVLLYDGVWDNKPPLLYFVYAFFDGDQFLVRLFSFIVGIICVVLFYKIADILLQKKLHASIITVVFAVFFGSPYLEGNIANAENFMLFPILLGLLLILQHVLPRKEKSVVWIKNPQLSFILGGLSLGISFMIKTVGVFDFLTISFFLLFLHYPLQKKIIEIGVIFLGFLVPFFLLSIYFLSLGILDAYFQATFFSNVSYVGFENYFLFPQGLLILKLSILGLYLFSVFVKRKKLSDAILFITIWFGFSLFNSFFSQRSYTHYLLLSLPSILLIGGIIYETSKLRLLFAIGYIAIIIGMIIHFKPYPLTKTISYYENFISYLSGKKTTYDYQIFFDSDVPRDYEISEYLNLKLSSDDRVFIFGNSAQIYVLSDTLPINRYTVAYHINTDDAKADVQESINTIRPEYIVVLPDVRLNGISLPNYVYRLSLGETAIYENTN